MKLRFHLPISGAFAILCLLLLPGEPARDHPHPPSPARHSAPAGTAFLFSSTGPGQDYIVALDQAAEILPDGGVRYRRLEPSATPETLAGRLRALSAVHESLPVCYRSDQPRTPENRRLVTRSLTLKLAGGRSPLALPPGIEWESAPPYAPGYAIASAPDPLAAIAALPALREHPAIAAAEVQLAIQRRPRAMPSDPLVANQWHFKFQNQPNVASGSDVNIENAWRFGDTGGVRGAGIRIGIIDDGLLLTHPDLAANIDSAHHWDWNGNDANPSPTSSDTHGTPCAGNAAARAENGTGGCGAAPEATLVGLRLIAAPATDAQEAAAFAHFSEAIHIKSNSWGPDDSAFHLDAPGPLARAALAHAAANGRGGLGTIFVWAAGNGLEEQDNSNYDGYANDIHTIAVTATDSLLRQAYYAEPGANILVAAPSSGRFTPGIVTTDLIGFQGYNSSSSASGGDYYDDFGGTSSATPIVAGIVALMLEKNPSLGWRDVQEILIRSAKRINSFDSDWSENAAGFRFNHKFGAGLVDATAAVDLAGSWSPLPPATRLDSARTGLSIPIPDNNAAGAELHFAISPENLRCEHVQLTLSASHTRRGDLEITLISPSGMTSRLAALHTSSTSPYSGWTFSSVRHWGEEAAGTWTLRVADRRTGVSGTLTAATLTLHGTPLDPVNPPPAVTISSPASGSIFSPADTIEVVVSASDLNADGSAGTVASVQLLDHGSPIAESDTEPFVFHLNPGIGNLLLTAVATDAEGLPATSLPVAVSVVNQPPVIHGATLSASSWIYSDETLSVVAVNASDPDLDPLSFTYLWEHSTDALRWTLSSTDGPDLPPDAANAGLLWRCRIIASDGGSTSTEYPTTPVNILARPPAAVAGSFFAHTSGLLLPGSAPPFSRQAILNEISQGSLPGTGWLELLTLKPGPLAGWKIADGEGNELIFADAPLWQSLPAGTLVVIHRGGAKDPILPAGNTDPATGSLIIPHDHPDLFSGPWPSLGDGAGSISLRDPAGTLVAGLSHGSGSIAPALPPIGPGTAAYYADRTETGLTSPASWTLTSAPVARSPRGPRAPGDLFFSEYVEGTSNNRAVEIYNPGSTPVSLSGDNYRLEIYANGAASFSSFVNLNGTVPPGGVFVLKHASASSAIVAQQTSGALTFTGNDAVILKKAGAIVDAIGRIGENPGSAWTGGGVTTIDATLRRKPSILTGDTNAHDPFDPSVEWTGHPLNDFTGLGWHTADESRGLDLTLVPSVVSETAGALAATGRLSLPEAAENDIPVSLTSSMPAVVVVPAEILIPAGAEHAEFPIAVVDDAIVTGMRDVLITASSHAAGGTVATLFVTDDEAPLEGVTPGAGNTPENLEWIADIRDGHLDFSARFRLADGVTLPEGLSLDPISGVLSGTVTAPPGTYPVTIELSNDSGETVTHSFSLEIADPPDYAAWIALHHVADPAPEADPDGDGHANLLEYYLGGDPTRPDSDLAPSLSMEDDQLVVSFWHRIGASGVTAAFEWSADLAPDSWQPLDADPEIMLTESWRERLRIHIPTSSGGRLFIRLTTD